MEYASAWYPPDKRVLIWCEAMSETSAAQATAWYVLRVTYQREMAAKSVLDELHVENFLPMHKVRRRGRQGRFVWCHEVAVHNYIFVHADRARIDALKHGRLPFLRYVMQTADGLRKPQVVPDSQMKSFIAVAGNTEERVLFLDPVEVDLAKGDKVRILGGPFEGVEGVFVRLKRQHEKRVVVRIEGIVAVATTTLPAALVEKMI